ncbi:MAG TPA: hypothetical protein VEW66_04330 [Thermomicrobiales bacterium]|nr:hypothetical protein [Thermomicrobiales bacterium]
MTNEGKEQVEAADRGEQPDRVATKAEDRPRVNKQVQAPPRKK